MTRIPLFAFALTLASACSGERAIAPASAPAPNAPLVVVDGKEVRVASLDSLRSLSIDRVEVIKGSLALARYGERGRNGVILIATRQSP